MPSNFLSRRLILAIHRDLINTFGGSHGIRDEGLLESALEQPRASFEARLLHRTIYDQAAAYLFHLLKNHPFVDGNKRAAFAAMDIFLRMNGLRLTLRDAGAYRLVIDVANGKLTKRQIATTLRKNTEHVALTSD